MPGRYKKAIAPKESEIKRVLIEWLRLHGCFCWTNSTTGIYDPKRGVFRRLQGSQIRGVSDILGIWLGKPLAIEVKRPGLPPSLFQMNFIETFKAHGGIAFIASSIEDLEANLKT